MERTPHTPSPRNSTEQLPKVQVQSHNLQYARLLMDDYAGPDGELTAILTYNYQNTCLLQQYPNVARQLERVAIEEMHHLHALGTVIHQLGPTRATALRTTAQWAAIIRQRCCRITRRFRNFYT